MAGAEHDRCAQVCLQLADRLLGQLTQRVGIGVLDRRDQRYAVDHRGKTNDPIYERGNIALLQLAQLVLQALHAINELAGRDYRIPVLSYSELTGLLVGWDPYEVVGVQGHTTPVEPFLEKVGIPYERSGALLT